jgi:hypothetical protein
VSPRNGSWFSYEDQRIGQAHKNAKTHLKDHEEIGEAIEHAIRANAGPQPKL